MPVGTMKTEYTEQSIETIKNIQTIEVIIGRRLHATRAAKSTIWLPTKDLF
jgi:hypothetical protein